MTMMNSEDETNEMMDEEVLMEMMASLNTCVNVEELQEKVFGYVLSLDPSVLDMDNPGGDMTPEEQVNLLNPLFSLLAPEGQSMCTDAQFEQVKTASEHFNKCDEMESFSDPQQTAALQQLSQDIQDACADDMTALSSTDVNDAWAPDDACMDAVLGDNLYGDLFRHVYLNIGEICGCVPGFQTELPDCTMTLASMVAATDEPLPESFDPAYLKLEISTTILKQSYCIIGLGCDMLIETGCGSELDALKSCLVELPDSDNGGEDPAVCEESVLFTAPPQLSHGLLPDICLEDSNSDDVASLYKSFFEQNYPDLADSETTLTNSLGASNAKGNDSTNSTSHVFAVFAAVGVVAAAAFMMNRRGRHSHMDQSAAFELVTPKYYMDNESELYKV
jgi:hypothetical protein